MKHFVACLTLIALLTPALAVNATDAVRVTPVAAPPALTALPVHVPGRVLRAANGDSYQWPGVYFEARFHGPQVFFKLGSGKVILRVLVDGGRVTTLTRPAPGAYAISGLTKGEHTARIEVLTESQAGPNVFGGFFHAAGTRPLSPQSRARQIEFIGDSHTVGYGNTSPTRDCDDDTVWSTTDNTAAFGPKIAAHFGADYQVNAISGRGIVRNYNGGPGDPLPVAYPYSIFDHGARYENATWRPRVIVMALGTNDFSTPLNAGEKWATREALHADYAATYLKFLDSLRARNPEAWIFIWAIGAADEEIPTQVRQVVERRQALGDTRIEFVPVGSLAMDGCHWHPSVADDDLIVARLLPVIEARQPW